MVYADRDVVRKLAGNFSPTQIPDSDIDTVIAYSDSRIDLLTGQTGTWDPTTKLFPSVKAASEHFAAARLREMYNDPGKRADAQYTIADDIVDDILEFSTSTEPSPLHVVKSSTYATYPLNLNGEIFWTNRRRRIGNVQLTSKDVVFP